MGKRRRKGTALVLCLLGVLVTGCGEQPESGKATPGRTGHAQGHGDRPAARPGKPKEVEGAVAKVFIDTFAYDPPRLVVRPGTRVTWVNRDDVPHTVTSSDEPKKFASGALDTDEQFSHTFTAPGTYPYFCGVHPKMTAQVVVK
jgi:plastocyanin